MKASKPRKSSRKSAGSSNVRAIRQPVWEEHLTVGIDPANETSGLALLDREGGLLWCGGDISVWNTLPPSLIAVLLTCRLEEAVRCKPPVLIVYEYSQHVRNRQTSDSISRSAGMLIEKLSEYLTITRSNVKSVQPNVWRKHIFGRVLRGDTKAPAVEMYRAMVGHDAQNHDAAEAFLIARYGYEMGRKK